MATPARWRKQPRSATGAHSSSTQRPADVSWSLADGVGLTVFVALAFVWWGPGDPTLFTSGVVAVGGLACVPFALERWRCGAAPARWTWVPVGAAGVLLVWACLSTIFTGAPWAVSLFGWFGRSDGLMLLLGVVGLFVASLSLASAEVTRLISWLLCAGGVIVFWGVAQLVGLPYPALSGYEGLTSSLMNPNILAAVSAILALLCVPRLLVRGQPSRLRWLIGGLLAGLVAMSFLSLSAQGPVSLTIGLLFMGLVAMRWVPERLRVAAAVACGTVILGGIALLGAIIARLGPLATVRNMETIGYRELYWETGWRMLQALPVFGTGPDGFGRFVSQFRTEDYIASRGSVLRASVAHDVPLQYGATLGWVGLGAWLVIVVSVSVILFIAVLRKSSVDLVGLGLIAAWAAFNAQSLISADHPALKTVGWVLAGVCIAWAVQPTHSSRRPSLVVAVASSALAALAATASITALVASMPPGRGAMLSSMTSSLSSCTARLDGLLLLAGSGRIADASALASSVYDLDPRCPALAPRVAALLLNEGDVQSAKRVAVEGVEMDPLAADSWFALALVADAEGDEIGKARAIAEVLRLDAIDQSVDLSRNLQDLDNQD